MKMFNSLGDPTLRVCLSKNRNHIGLIVCECVRHHFFFFFFKIKVTSIKAVLSHYLQKVVRASPGLAQYIKDLF